MSVFEVLLRVTAALVLGEPGSGALPLLAVAALGLTTVAVAVLFARVLALVLGVVVARVDASNGAPADLVTRIAWSHPDAEGHARPRAPGAVAPA